jgi:putative ATPase
MAINKAIEEVRKTGNLPIPLHIRNAPTKLMKDLGYGANYKYAHDFDNHFINDEYLPKEISGNNFYEPQTNAREKEISTFLHNLWKGKYGY